LLNRRWLNAFFAIVSGIALLAMPAVLHAKDSHQHARYFAQLDALDDIRLIDTKAFQIELAQMQPLSANFNAAEQDYFVLLQAYDAALSSDFSNTISLLESRWSNASDQNMQLRMLSLLVNSLVLSQNYLPAFEFFEQLIAVNTAGLAEKALVQRIGVIALLYNRLGKYDLANYYLKDIDTLPISSSNRCRLYWAKTEAMVSSATIAEFETVAQHARDLCAAENENINVGLIVAEIIRFNLLHKRYENAINIYQSFQPLLYRTQYNFLIAKVNAYASVAYFNADQPVKAEQLALEALSFDNLRRDTIPIIEAAKSLYMITKAQNRDSEALRYLEIYLDAQRQYNDDLAAQLLAYNLAKSEVEVKNQRIALLNKDNDLLHLQKDIYEQQVRQTHLLIAGLALVLFAVSVVTYRAVSGRKRFKKIAEFDLLTGVSNRYHFTNQATLALEFCEKNRKPVAVILFDLDHFKSINDNFGHAAGDWALQAVVAACRNFMRNNDVFGRIGGEEFAIVLPGCQTDKALLLADICRDAISAIDTAASGADFSLSASFGVSGSQSSGYVLKQLLADADKALYRAKTAGRDQVVGFAEA